MWHAAEIRICGSQSVFVWLFFFPPCRFTPAAPALAFTPLRTPGEYISLSSVDALTGAHTAQEHDTKGCPPRCTPRTPYRACTSAASTAHRCSPSL